jgi:hypothetical protein
MRGEGVKDQRHGQWIWRMQDIFWIRWYMTVVFSEAGEE